MLNKNKIKKILVIKTRALGDTLLATPTIHALRQEFLQAYLTVLVSPKGQEIVQANPDIDEIIVYDKTNFNLKAYWQLIKKIKREKFDLSIALHASFRTALIARLSQAPYRVVNNHSGSNYFATIKIIEPKIAKSSIQRDLDAVRALGINKNPSEKLILNINISANQRVEEFLETNKIIKDNYLVLFPDASKEYKKMPINLAVDILSAIYFTSKLPWVILSSPNNKVLAEEIKKRLNLPVSIFAGNIKEVGVLLNMSQGLVTTDSGPKHIAVAVNTPTLTLWTNEPESEWHPYAREKHKILRSNTGKISDISSAEVVTKIKHFFDI